MNKAKAIAYAVHAGKTDQVGDPYIEHVRGVVELTSRLGWFQRLALEEQDIVPQSAWLHDTLEDTPLEADNLLGAGFDPRVVETVKALFNHPDETRKAYYQRILRLGATGSSSLRQTRRSRPQHPSRAQGIPPRIAQQSAAPRADWQESRVDRVKS